MKINGGVEGKFEQYKKFGKERGKEKKHGGTGQRKKERKGDGAKKRKEKRKRDGRGEGGGAKKI